jgi:hypothetical protein
MTTTDSTYDAARRVEELRTLSLTDGNAAQDAAWGWITDLQTLAKKDSESADAQLNELFRLGVPPIGLDGPTDGILVMTTTNPVTDAAVKAVTALWMPWQGKRFVADAGTGDNRMTGVAALASKLLWPMYSMKDAEAGKLAFDFKTYVEDGKLDPDREVMVIDYADIEKNPMLIIKSIRDELVEIVTGSYLGKILYRTPSEKYLMVGYFALRTP